MSGVTFCACGMVMCFVTNLIKFKCMGEVCNFFVYKCKLGELGYFFIVKEVLDKVVCDGVVDVLWCFKGKFLK